MASAECIELRGTPLPYFNKDGSYARFGVQMEISKNVIRVPNHPSLELMAEARGMNIVPRFPEIPSGISFLCRPDIKTHAEPAKHNNNSSAEYVIDWHRYKSDDGRENILWLSRIPPNKGTSRPPHAHGVGVNGKGVFEQYLKIAGTVYIGEGDGRRLMGEYEVVPPGTEHYIEAGEEGAAFFILIENVEGIKNEDIHQFPQIA